MKKALFLFVCSLFAMNSFAQIFPSDKARFHWGDNMEWKNPKFDDSSWMEISTARDWGSQGMERTMTYAWYRVHFKVDKSIFDGADQQSTLRLTIPYVDDAEVTYLNGVEVGSSGRLPDHPEKYASAWAVPRVYFIPASVVNFEGDNVLAIRMWNEGGEGGMSLTASRPKMNFSLSAPSRVDGVKFSGKEVVLKGQKMAKLIMTNDYAGKQVGEYKLTSYDPSTGKEFATIAKKVTVASHQSYALSVPCVEGYQRVKAVYTDKATGKSAEYEFTPKYILTPKAPESPRFNMAGIYGVRPGSPVIYRLPVSGERPMKFSASNLPAGLSLDAEKGVISGKLEKRGDYILNITAENAKGKADAQLTIRVGNTLALTPPMGWNSWNCWGLSVTQDRVISSAQALIDKGLADYGYSYINIDDGWEAPERNADGTIAVNEKFPSMKNLGDWLHGEGLKFGIYSSPGDLTCGGYLGSIDHELQDAESYNSWGIDYLKYDWCGYSRKHATEPDNNTIASYVRPYLLMERCLRQQPRDIFYSLCQYGMQEVWKWGHAVDANSWRTTGDITDTWESLYNIGFEQQTDLYPYAAPGHWNDPDMLIVGKVGWSDNLRDSRLTPDEQYTHISLWCLLASNMLIGCDIAQMDEFTVAILCNNEVNAINQDVLGKQAQKVYDVDGVQIWSRPLADGGTAVGIFNLNEKDVTFDFGKQIAKLGLNGKKLRDLWRQQDTNATSFFIPTHGVVLLKAK